MHAVVNPLQVGGPMPVIAFFALDCLEADLKPACPLKLQSSLRCIACRFAGVGLPFMAEIASEPLQLQPSFCCIVLRLVRVRLSIAFVVTRGPLQQKQSFSYVAHQPSALCSKSDRSAVLSIGKKGHRCHLFPRPPLSFILAAITPLRDLLG